MGVSIKKTIALVIALAKLHNYCIDCSDNAVVPSTASDEWRSEVQGAVPLVPIVEEHRDLDVGMTPRQLLDGGNHFDDVGINGRYNRQRRYNYMSESAGTPLPREYLHSLVASAGVTRPSIIARGATSTIRR